MIEELDKAIDEVAQEMTAAEPPVTLRADVLARLDRERTPRTSGLVLPRWAWAGVAAALIVGVATTIWMTRPEPPATRVASTSKGPERPAVPAAAASPAPESLAASAQPAPLPRPARPPAQARRVGLPDDAGPAPLAGPPAIDIAPLGPAAIAIPELGVAALDEIEPITVSTIGPGSPEPQRRESK
jgi:hypothetical protein